MIETPPQTPLSHSPQRTAPRRKLKRPRILSSTLLAAALVATLFTAFPATLFSTNLRDQLAVLLTPQAAGDTLPGGIPRPQIKIGIVAGHWGNDSGAVCENGTTEADVNLKIATLVQQKMTALGFETDLLKEFDPIGVPSGYKPVKIIF